MKQALLDGINQSQSTLFFPDYRHLNPTSRNRIRQVRDNQLDRFPKAEVKSLAKGAPLASIS